MIKLLRCKKWTSIYFPIKRHRQSHTLIMKKDKFLHLLKLAALEVKEIIIHLTYRFEKVSGKIFEMALSRRLL
jgi:hypothetical protein